MMDATVKTHVRSLLCNANDSVLCIVDLQDRIIEGMQDKVKYRLRNRTRELLEVAKVFDIPVIASERTTRTSGSIIPEIIHHLPEETLYLDKDKLSCCGNDDIFDFLEKKGRNQIILVGIELHISVLQTAIELKENGYDVFLVEDAVGSLRLDSFINALKRMAHCGICITSTESVIGEWIRDAKQYTQISELKEINLYQK